MLPAPGPHGTHANPPGPRGGLCAVITESKQLFLAFLIVLGVLTAQFPAVSLEYHENHSLSKNMRDRQ